MTTRVVRWMRCVSCGLDWPFPHGDSPQQPDEPHCQVCAWRETAAAKRALATAEQRRQEGEHQPDIRWEYEDQLPLSAHEYDQAYPLSRVIRGVRMFPYAVIEGERVYLAAVQLMAEVERLRTENAKETK